MLSMKKSVGKTLLPRSPTLETSDIQATVLRPRPKPYCGEYVVLRIGDAEQGREMLCRILPHVAPADEWWVPSLPGWLGIAFTFEGLKALNRNLQRYQCRLWVKSGHVQRTRSCPLWAKSGHLSLE